MFTGEFVGISGVKCEQDFSLFYRYHTIEIDVIRKLQRFCCVLIEIGGAFFEFWWNSEKGTAFFAE